MGNDAAGVRVNSAAELDGALEQALTVRGPAPARISHTLPPRETPCRQAHPRPQQEGCEICWLVEIMSDPILI